MTTHEALLLGSKRLVTKSTSANLDSEVLLSFVLKKDKSHFFAHPENILTDIESKEYLRLIGKRTKRQPIAYLTGQKEFRGLDFTVDKNVLIPRPETEGLVEIIIEAVKRKKNLKILDIGTGSGAIIVSLSDKLGPIHQYFASDVSVKALEVAESNAKKHSANITFKQSSLLKNWDEQFDIIVANLPYLAEKTLSTKFEPKIALVAKHKGIHIIQNLIVQIKNLNYRPSYIFLEIGHDQKSAIKNLAEKYLPDYDIKVSKDLFNQPRYAILKIPSR